jgi:uncharacterized protein HemX
MDPQKGSLSTATSAKANTSWLLAAALATGATIAYHRQIDLLHSLHAMTLDVSLCPASRARRTE